MHVTNTLPSTAGFTLIEFIIIIAMVAIAIVPLANMFLQGVSGTFSSDVITIANGLAQEKMEEYREQEFSSLSSSSGAFVSPFDDYSYTVDIEYGNADFSPSASATDYRLITVTVGHDSGESVSLTTVTADKS